MRRTHVIGIAVVALLTASSVAQAQTAATSSPRAGQQRVGRFERGRGRLLRGIKLSDAEKARVKEIRGKYQTESKALRKSHRPAMQAEIRSALTPEHQAQFDANVKQLADRRAERKNAKPHRHRRAEGAGTNKG